MPLKQPPLNLSPCHVSFRSRPGQCGRVDGYVLEGKELEFYAKKMQKKAKH
jgi:hypothetical protein